MLFEDPLFTLLYVVVTTNSLRSTTTSGGNYSAIPVLHTHQSCVVMSYFALLRDYHPAPFMFVVQSNSSSIGQSIK